MEKYSHPINTKIAIQCILKINNNQKKCLEKLDVLNAQSGVAYLELHGAELFDSVRFGPVVCDLLALWTFSFQH